jgi:hypothetical protein
VENLHFCWRFPQATASSRSVAIGLVRLIQPLPSLRTARRSKPKTSVSTYANIDNESVNYDYFQAEQLCEGSFWCCRVCHQTD